MKLWRPWWSRAPRARDGHTDPNVERQAAEVFGKLSYLTAELEDCVRMREERVEDGDDTGGHG